MSNATSDPMYSLNNPYFTYQWSKYSCISGFYFAHVIFCYIVMIAGFGCLFSRFVPHTKWTHVWFGRLYLLSMFWAMGTSMLIHNTGLPAAVLISFLWVGLGLTFGWPIAIWYQSNMQKAATKAVAENIKLSGAVINPDELGNMIQAEKGKIGANRTFKERLFSLKTLHGALMVTSWVNIIGRVFVTPLGSDFTCYTANYYKQIDTKHFQGADVPPTPVPTNDPNYYKLPWAKTGLVGWGILLSVVPLIGCFLIAAIWTYVAARKAQKAEANAPKSTVLETGAPAEEEIKPAVEKAEAVAAQ